MQVSKEPEPILPGSPTVVGGAVLKKLQNSANQAMDVFNKEQAEHTLRSTISGKMTSMFISANVIILILVVIIFAVDSYFVYYGKIPPAERIVGGNTIITLIGATTVQLGALIAVMAGWLFPKEK